MDWLNNLKSSASNLWNDKEGKMTPKPFDPWAWTNLFGKKQTQTAPQNTIQAGPGVYTQEQAGLYRPGFVGPVPPPQDRGTLPMEGDQSNQSMSSGGATPPPYAPNTENQTVSYGGVTWKGNPGTGWTQEGGGGGMADSLLQALVNPLQSEIESWWKKLDEYDKNNPFAFDEALARASSQERLNPYYDATLNEFMTGVRASSSRSVEDMTRTVGELNTDASKLSDQERLSTQEAIRSSEEGFAGAGLFFSGKRERQTGLEEVQGGQAQEAIQTNLQRGTASAGRSNTRLQEDLALQTARQKRLTSAERTTALETDISKQKREAELQRGLERLQFAGKIPGSSPAEQMQLENQFLTGLS
jgi:hypothetical protein